MYINWYHSWSESVLFKVANVFLEGHPSIPECYRNDIIQHVVYVHNSLKLYIEQYSQQVNRRNFVTPKHYLEYIQTYLKLLGEF